ncbi:MAG: hypothetical protein AMDU2_EPLC00008G0007 [Thermoplasmatales archaeon E-plasma]|nr:MAG: hypothetical protein AMDU2_EPLC00008G0007 [Thermoplasmatales archaeon E-plasma]
MSEWGNLDILEACGAFDPGSNPGSGVFEQIKLKILQI